MTPFSLHCYYNLVTIIFINDVKCFTYQPLIANGFNHLNSDKIQRMMAFDDLITVNRLVDKETAVHGIETAFQ